MADDTPLAPPSPAGSIQDIGGGALRVTPQTGGEPNPTLEEQAATQAAAAAGKEGEPPAPAGKEGEPPAPAKEGAKEGEPPKPFDFAGSIFEGVSEEMKGKVAPFAAAYAENGTLTEAEVTEAAKATGFSEAAVRQFMAGATSTAAQQAAPVFEAFGGQPQFREFQDWSKQEGKLTPAEEKTINRALAGNDYETAAQLMQPAMERWKADGGGVQARDVTAAPQGAPGASQGDVYANWKQVEKDMGSADYQNDPAFRDKVKQKMARSQI